MVTPVISYPKNRYVYNSKLGALYLSCLRKQWRIPGKILGTLLNCDIFCKIPDRLFIPHPYGIVAGGQTVLSNDVVLLQQATLGCLGPYDSELEGDGYPVLMEGVYVGPGARILGHVIVGEWAVIGANAVVTVNVPPYSVVVGHNKVLEQKSSELFQ
jgi:serine acetyltransferase